MKLTWNDSKSVVAKDLFGRPLRVVLAAWILDKGEPFYLQEAQQAMLPYGLSGSGVPKELRNFEAHGMLTELADGRRIYFSMLESPYWAALAAIVESFNSVPETADR